jgi:hypothetical protein
MAMGNLAYAGEYIRRGAGVAIAGLARRQGWRTKVPGSTLGELDHRLRNEAL